MKVMEARTPEEKLRALQEFLAAVPKHKGTAKLIAHVRRQMAMLRREIEERRRKRTRGFSPFAVKREGDVLVCLIGFANCGKSSILRRLTNAKPKVSPVPFSTPLPVRGMLIYKGVLIQLVEVPAIAVAGEKSSLAQQSLAIARNSDGMIIVLDGKEDPIKQLYVIIKILEDARISVIRPEKWVEIRRTREGGIRVIGELEGCTIDDVRKLLNSYKIYNAVIRVRGSATLDDIEEALYGDRIYKPTIIMVNKVESPQEEAKVSKLRNLIKNKLPLLAVSALRGTGLDPNRLGELILKTLGLIRVYTKEPGLPPSEKPLVLPEGSRVIDVAARIHSYLKENFKYAKVWSSTLPFSPQRVGPEFILHDGDIVEIHA